MSASEMPARPRFPAAVWPDPAAVRLQAREILAPGTVLPVALDLARGVAALAVLAFHLRSWLMVPYAAAAPHGPVLASLYLVTGFGHEAVIVFFVLSGFLIGGAVLRLDFDQPGAVGAYAAARLARIGPVLVGAVALALAARGVTASWSEGAVCHDTLGTVVGNLLALGNLGVPPLCNDMPLWSLSNEVVYYLAFPTLVALARGRRSPGLLGCAALALAIGVASVVLTPWNDQNVLLYFPVWLAGAALWWLPRRALPMWPGLLLFPAALMASRLPGADRFFYGRDLMTTLGFAALLAGLVGRPWPRRGLLGRAHLGITIVAGGLASFSFSLYVIHNPVIDLYMRWAGGRGVPLPFTTPVWPVLIGLFGTSIGAALILSQFVERPHRAIAAALTRFLVRGRKASAREA